MRMRWIWAVLAMSTPAVAQDAPGALDVTVTDLAVTSRGGVALRLVQEVTATVNSVVEQCYRAALDKAPTLTGALAISFKLDPQGVAADIAATGVASVNACVAADLKAPHRFRPGAVAIELREKLRLAAPAGLLGVADGHAVAALSGGVSVSGGLDDAGSDGDVPRKPDGDKRRGTMSIGQPVAQGELDKAIIRRDIKRHIQEIESCYEKQLATSPGLAGTATARFTIGSDGLVAESTASGIAVAEVNTCIASIIKRIEFPRPKGGGEIHVTFPFMFLASTP